MSDTGDRTLPATPRRREAARRAGSVPAATGPAWAASAATAILLGPAWLRATVPAATDVLRETLAVNRPPEFTTLLPVTLLLPTIGIVSAAGAAGLAVRLLIDGLTWHPGRLVPDLRRIDPGAGLARILSVRSLVAALGAGIGLALLVGCGFMAAGPLADLAAGGAALEDPARLASAASRPLAWVVVATCVVAAVQWAFARHRFEAALRMTPQEFADESRGLQADPQVRLLHWNRSRPTVRRPDAPPEPAPARGSRSGR